MASIQPQTEFGLVEFTFTTDLSRDDVLKIIEPKIGPVKVPHPNAQSAQPTQFRTTAEWIKLYQEGKLGPGGGFVYSNFQQDYPYGGYTFSSNTELTRAKRKEVFPQVIITCKDNRIVKFQIDLRYCPN